MLLACNKCRTTREVKLKVENPNNVKLNKTAVQKDKTIKVEPVCMTCGATAAISEFVLNLMIDKHEYMPEKKSKSTKAKCHSCMNDQEVKLDKQTNPRCMRCGGIVKMTQFAVKAMKLFMSDEELAKWDLN